MSTEVKISVREFEKKVREKEEVTIVVRAPASEMVGDYNFDRKTSGSTSITDWIDKRIKPRLGDFEFDVVSPDYVVATPHGRTKMETLRSQYER